MINNISWENYAYTLGIVLIFYYAFVLLVLYRSELRAGISKLIKNTGYPSQDQQSPADEKRNSIDSNAFTDIDNQNTSIGELLLRLQSLIQNAATRDFPKEELLLSLQLELKKYKALKDGVHLETINNFIISECKNYCSMHLNGYEVGSIWG